MADREDYYSDEFDSCEDDVQDEKEIKPKRSKASPRPKSAFKKTTKKAGKADGYRSRPASVPASKATSRDMWLNAVKTGGPSKNKGHVGKRTTAEYWTDTLRKTGFGISTESGANGMTNLRKAQGMAYSSTSHYLRQVAGLEKGRKVASDPTAKAATRVPAYKEPEEYYDDILALKKQMMLISTENSTLKSKLRRLEEDNLKKAKEIEQLLDPSKGEELRKTLGDRKPDAGTMIQSLKQKMLKLEHQLREKETAFNKLQSDLKTTKIEEMKLQMEQFYREVIRLSQLKNTTTNGHRNEKSLRENPSKLKALQETILRLNEKNLTLTNENKTLKQDLQALMDDRDTANENEKEYRDMSKRELMAAISKLEKKVDRGEVETMSVTSDVSHRRKEKEGKLSLQGTMAQRFDQLDKRETELLEDIEKQRGLTKKMKDDRAHYRKKCEDKDKEIRKLKGDLEEVHAELDTFYEKDKASVTPRQPTPRRRSSVRKTSRSSSVTSLENEKQLRVEEFRKQVAAQHIQRQWKQRKSKKEHEEEEKRIRSFQEKRAARCIQGAWHDHRRDVECRDQQEKRVTDFKQKHAVQRIERVWLDIKTDRDNNNKKRVKDFKEKRAVRRIERAWLDHKMDKETKDAAELLQAAMRGHQVRKRKMSGLRRDVGYDDDTATESDVISITSHRELHRQRRSLDSDRDVDHAVMTLQSVFRGHMARKKQMTQRRSPSGFRNGRTRQESIDRYSTPSTSRRSSLKRSKTPPEEEDSEEESEDSDEICVGSR